MPAKAAVHHNRSLRCAKRWALAKKRKSPEPAHQARSAIFQDEFRTDLRYWVETDRRTALRVLELVEAIMREPFSGIGKPEPLKHAFKGYWSRRINEEHRIVYKILDDSILIAQLRYHY